MKWRVTVFERGSDGQRREIDSILCKTEKMRDAWAESYRNHIYIPEGKAEVEIKEIADEPR